VVGLFLFACAATSSCATHSRVLGYPVPPHRPVAILVKTNDQVDTADDGGGLATLVETLGNELKEAGIDSQVYASKEDHPPPPRIELDVTYWHGTSRSSHQLANAGLVVPGAAFAAVATSGSHIVLDCRVFLAGGEQPVFNQHFDQSALGAGLTGADDNAAASKAGSAIAAQILTR